MGWLLDAFIRKNNVAKNIADNEIKALDIFFMNLQLFIANCPNKFYTIEIYGEKVNDGVIMVLIMIELYIFAILQIDATFHSLKKYLNSLNLDFFRISIDSFSKNMLITENGKKMDDFLNYETLYKAFQERYDTFLGFSKCKIDENIESAIGLSEQTKQFAWIVAQYEDYIIKNINAFILSKQKYGDYYSTNKITSVELEEFDCICVHKFCILDFINGVNVIFKGKFIKILKENK